MVTKPHSVLPKAPLIEVVFEMRWGLGGDETSPEFFRNDPGYYVLAEDFPDAARLLGFHVQKKLSNESMVAGYSVDRRFYKSEEKAFPLMQIGPGIFAVNESAGYSWVSYKKACHEGVKALIRSYPRMRNFELVPKHLELRYVDSFKIDDNNNIDLLNFIAKYTSLRISVPKFVPSMLGNAKHGRVVLEFPVKGMKDTNFEFTLGNAKAKGVSSFILQSKVVTKSDKIAMGNTEASRLKYISEWLEKAHAVTSPFFKEFVNEELMGQFK